VQCAVCGVQRAVCSVHSVQYAVCTVCTVCSVQDMQLRSVQHTAVGKCALFEACSVHWGVYIVHSTVLDTLYSTVLSILPSDALRALHFILYWTQYIVYAVYCTQYSTRGLLGVS
jgi:hypothetical protein